jgi:pyrroline-5-carboxylate reductase
VSTKLGIIGGGVMAEAILSRLITAQIYAPTTISVSEPQPQRREYLQQKYSVSVTFDNRAIAACDVLLLAVKPQVLDAVIASFVEGTNQTQPSLIISILAGVPLSRLETAFPGKPVIRAMPNTPATVGAGITAIAPGKKVEAMHLSLARTIFESIGQVVEVSEYLMDAVTGLSGSGPAYVAIMVEALADGGVAAGLPRPVASQLALQTVLGTAKLISDSGLHPAELKDRVTSPGGTTIAGVSELEKAGFRSALIEAVKAASLRSQELGKY